MSLKRSRTIRLTLLAGLGLPLSACSSASTPEYTRMSFNSNQACYNEYRMVPGLTTPCIQNGNLFYGPYMYGSGDVHYLGYSPLGTLLTAGIVYNLATRRSSSYRESGAARLAKSAVTRAFARSSAGSSASSSSSTRTPAASSSTVSRSGFGSSSRSSSGSFGG